MEKRSLGEKFEAKAYVEARQYCAGNEPPPFLVGTIIAAIGWGYRLGLREGQRRAVEAEGKRGKKTA